MSAIRILSVIFSYDSQISRILRISEFFRFPSSDSQIFQRLILAVLTRTPETGVELSEAETTLPDLSLSS